MLLKSTLLSALLLAPSNAFVVQINNNSNHNNNQSQSQSQSLARNFATRQHASVTSLLDDTFSPPDIMGFGEISEQACADAASKMKRVKVPVPEYVSDDGEVGISYVHWPAVKSASSKKTLPIILVHGFDSSCLEYRRLGPKLAELGIDTYAVDLLGWGYSQLDSVNSFSADAKVDALKGFWEVVGDNKPVSVAGASLGGAASIIFAADNPDIVKGCVFIDAQGFTDGVGPMAFLPKFLAEAGVNVLKSEPLRSSANQMSYYDTETYATDDAVKVGRLHCLRDGWNDALVSFMTSGGFAPSKKVPLIEAPSLILWGRQDTILDVDFAQKFLDTLQDGQIQWVEECGHVPHLEQPKFTAEAINNFLTSDKFVTEEPDEKDNLIVTIADGNVPTTVVVGGLGAAAIAAAAVISSSM